MICLLAFLKLLTMIQFDSILVQCTIYEREFHFDCGFHFRTPNSHSVLTSFFRNFLWGVEKACIDIRPGL
jgi:hypothetical protein